MAAGTYTAAQLVADHPEFATCPAAMVSAAVAVGNLNVDSVPYGSQANANAQAGWMACMMLASGDFGVHANLKPDIYKAVVDMLKRGVVAGPITTT